jgi:hypothetical protein
MISLQTLCGHVICRFKWGGSLISYLQDHWAKVRMQQLPTIVQQHSKP